MAAPDPLPTCVPLTIKEPSALKSAAMSHFRVSENSKSVASKTCFALNRSGHVVPLSVRVV